ncbi:hypothetical protein C4J85_2068 [Pseudomonas sp. R4-34-07]|nr:hypothetical protein C4J92_2116 [Pseudomonas sp. R3-18-08]AZF26246.1 hypothetical protein C4J90_2073 [Pseudomonas sp. R2-60-08W]AZF36886.1 hypothetical protein C4J88_2103 [Pseudomonas sp. R4-39-08]AZF52553.1 hypothetical protein C4J85_2068 [Pseudomonas sp. R4-34-07]
MHDILRQDADALVIPLAKSMLMNCIRFALSRVDTAIGLSNRLVKNVDGLRLLLQMH